MRSTNPINNHQQFQLSFFLFLVKVKKTWKVFFPTLFLQFFFFCVHKRRMSKNGDFHYLILCPTKCRLEIFSLRGQNVYEQNKRRKRKKKSVRWTESTIRFIISFLSSSCLIIKSEWSVECRGRRHNDDDDVDDDNKALKTKFVLLKANSAR